ncbi:MAG: 2-amino-4-hydroxy-6-hydroxymethyldihydropteridine diphosphokinase, partial [Oscillospiraceae bacterium]|nr:2-amino-4-hydroxy-6-hydroxymethyldihydropteridine diphosphokinase [Oscillospiraceae bacterium]
EAPVAMDFSSISVRIRRGWHKAVIALGSNIGDSRAYLQDAVQKLSKDPCIRNLIQSEWISTKPYGYTQQDDFLNGAVSLQTIYSPFRLLRLMQEIENQAGRTREIHWGPRTLDLDLIFYDDAIIRDPKLVVPHPDMHNRDFVLQPVAAIAPYYMHPVLRKTTRQLLEDLEQKHD